jgi:hypothetical protein
MLKQIQNLFGKKQESQVEQMPHDEILADVRRDIVGMVPKINELVQKGIIDEQASFSLAETWMHVEDGIQGRREKSDEVTPALT